MPNSVLITGASSGIGRALAIEFSRRGYALGLCARRLEILDNLRQELSHNHAVEIAELDVSQFEAVREVLLKLRKD
jgi:Short-chain dehydrogenases of various substrate specificities